MRRQVFIRWSIGLAAVWLFANWPYSSGLANFFWQAGFPFEFVSKWGNRPTQFDESALLLDVALGVVVVFGLAGLCAWSRKVPAKQD
jgi:hypothetical protein